jgi:hypothetical protein
MKTLYKRIERLSARIRRGAVREFTLEELCRLYWRMNKRGFKAFDPHWPPTGAAAEPGHRSNREIATDICA